MSRQPRPSRIAKTNALAAFEAPVVENKHSDTDDEELDYPLPLRQRVGIGRGHIAHSIPSPPSASHPQGRGIGRGILDNLRTSPPSASHPKGTSVGRGILANLRTIATCLPGGGAQVKLKSKNQKLLDNLINLPESRSGSENSSTDTSSEGDETSDSSTETCDSSSSGEIDYVGRDGTEWNEVTNESSGRLATQNIFRAKPGPTNYCRNVEEPIDAWRLFLDDGLLRYLSDCTMEYARSENENFSIKLQELEAFFGLLYIKGAMNQRNFPYDLLWSKEFGCEKFKKVMARDRFREIKKYLRFDERSSRSQRLQTDKYALMSAVHERIVENFQKAYIPHESLTADEQLFPCKVRCSFLQYMSNKPDKFGIKFWILTEVESKYCLNIIPYLGKDETRVASLGTHVVTSLMAPYLNKGYNVCTDNFFTSHQLAITLLEKSTSIVGTVRSNRRELPTAALSRMALYESKFFRSGQVMLVSYQAKKNKTVNLISTLHRGIACGPEGKKKPDVITFYNKNKCGVDLLDSMCKAMTTKIGTRRWPFAVFCNLLDITAINAWIIFKKKTSSNISRRKFLFKLGEQLTEENMLSRNMASSQNKLQSPNSLCLEKRVNCKVHINCERNRTSVVCAICRMPMCGQCQSKSCLKCDENSA
jgi:hypothetical protein